MAKVKKIIDSNIVGTSLEQVEAAKASRAKVISRLQELKNNQPEYEQEAYEAAIKVLESNSQASYWLVKTDWDRRLKDLVKLYEGIGDDDLCRIYGGKR